MKICMVTRTTVEHNPGGLQEDLRTLAEGAVKTGHRVIVITSLHPTGLNKGVRPRASRSTALRTRSWNLVKGALPLHHNMRVDLTLQTRNNSGHF